MKEKAKELANASPLDVFVWSEYPAVKKMFKKVYEEVLGYENRGKSRAKDVEDRFKSTLRVVLINLFVAWEVDSKRYVAYSRNKMSYMGESRYRRLFIKYQSMIDAVNALEALGYIENFKGYYFADIMQGKQSRMRATDKLVKLFLEAELNIYMIHCEDKPLIVLKDENKKKIEIEHTPETLKMEQNLKRINAVLKSQDINLEVTDRQHAEMLQKLELQGKEPVNFNRVTLHRVFNMHRFDLGGRFYGTWVHSIPNEYRKHITINGIKTVEVDFSGMHLDMLYAEKGIEPPEGDAYALDGYPEACRETIKTAFNSMVNAVNGNMQEPSDSVLPDGKSYKDLQGDILKKHEAIKEFFYSGKGRELQFKDSQIAEQVMIELLDYHRKDGTPLRVVAIPVHDSFIVIEGQDGILEKVMKKWYKKIVGRDAKVKFTQLEYDPFMQNIIDCQSAPSSSPLREPDYLDKQYSKYKKRSLLWWETIGNRK